MNTGKQPEYSIHYQSSMIQDLDPLGADALLEKLPSLNDAADTRGLWSLQQELTERTLQLLQSRTVTEAESLAVMRDLGIVLGSTKRHGTEPLNVTPELTPALLALGWKTNLIPRDTVQHSTTWNPRGPRRRMYTADQQERQLQDAVSDVFPH